MQKQSGWVGVGGEVNLRVLVPAVGSQGSLADSA